MVNFEQQKREKEGSDKMNRQVDRTQKQSLKGKNENEK